MSNIDAFSADCHTSEAIGQELFWFQHSITAQIT
jgi:hypothetical protein